MYGILWSNRRKTMPGVISNHSVLVRTSWMLVQQDRNSLKSCLMSYYVWHFKVTYSSISGTSRQHSSHILVGSICFQYLWVCGHQVDSISLCGPGCVGMRLGIGEPLLDFLILIHQCDGGLCFWHLCLNFQKFKSLWIDTMSWFKSTIIYWRFWW